VIFTTAFEKSISPLKLGCESQTLKFTNTFWMNMICKQNAHYSLMIKENTDAAFIRLTSMEFTGRQRRGGLIQ
jgi:hypothetical protein